MFKKFIAATLCLVAVLALAGCGNKSLDMGNYNFTKVHIFDGGEGTCCSVTKWYDAEVGIEVKTDKGALFLSEGTYMLVEGYCPVCQK